MTDSDAGANPLADTIDILRSILAVGAEIAAGDLRSLDDVLSSATLHSNSDVKDRQVFARSNLIAQQTSQKPNQDIIAALQLMHDDGSLPALQLARQSFKNGTVLAERTDFYLALAGDTDAAWRLVASFIQHVEGRTGRTLALATAIGLTAHWHFNDLRKVQGYGIQLLDDIGVEIKDIRGAIDLMHVADVVAAGDKKKVPATPAQVDDRPSYKLDLEPDPDGPDDGVIVVPGYKKPSSSDRARPKLDLFPIAGKRLPLSPTGDVRAHAQALADHSPHLVDVHQVMLRDTASHKHARFRPTILVGGPGRGKSSVVKKLAQVMGVPFVVFDAGGVADGVFRGTASHWATSGASGPLMSVFQTGVANPILIIDELEKAVASHNGSFHDSLLGFLDRGNASVYRDPALELPVDLSHVSYFLTANSLAGVPAPLRDRCRILEVPHPEWEHVGTLVRHIIRDIAEERNLDPRFYPPLAQDEMDTIKSTWTDGSLRGLRAAVEATLDVRDMILGRA